MPCDECRHLDVETYEIIGKLINSGKLRQIREKIKSEDEVRDMYDVIKELIKDGREEGRHEERIERAKQLTTVISNLMKNLHCSLEEACEFAGKTVEEYRQASELL